jgi:Fe-S cluster biogenesis protein NfuA
MSAINEEKLLELIEAIRPALQRDGGDIEYKGLEDDGTVNVRLVGACAGCPMSTVTLKQGIERFLKEEIPEIKEVVNI